MADWMKCPLLPNWPAAPLQPPILSPSGGLFERLKFENPPRTGRLPLKGA